MLVFGNRLYGKLLKCGESYVATWFFHVWFVPLIPLGSVVVLQHLDGNQVQTVKTSLQWRSLGLAYLRGWSVFLLLHGLLNWAEVTPEDPSLYGPVVSAVAVVLLVLGFAVLGRTDDATRARLEVYREVFGFPVDLALLGPAADGVAAAVHERLVSFGRTTAMNYRVMYDPATQWGLIALDPSMTDRAFLVHAMCLARIERARAQGESRAALDTLHDQIWARLQGLHAPAATAWAPPAAHP
ncbi:MAG: hypothetical protein U0325_10125 [Polyangiales bacterium]